MKKIVALIMALTLVFTCTACSAGGGNLAAFDETVMKWLFQ